MGICKKQSRTNNEESLLFNKIYELVGDENKATELYATFDELEFKKEFGDYASYYNNLKEDTKLNDPEFNKRLDDNFEPKLFYDSTLNKNYYLDKYNERFYFPKGRQGLSLHLDVNSIKTYAKTLALGYYKANFTFDFDNLEFKPNEEFKFLKNYIIEHLNNKADSLLNSLDIDAMLLGNSLDLTTDMVDEWINEVNDFYKSIKTELTINEIESQEEIARGDIFRVESFLKSSKDSINNNIKLFLSTIEGKELNEFEEKEFIPFDDIYSTLNKSLANKVSLINKKEDLYDIYLDEIKKLSSIKSYFEDVYDLLSGNKSKPISENFKNQFTSAFYLFKKNYLGSEISKNGKSYNIMNLSEVGSRKSNIILQWYYNYGTQINSRPGILQNVESNAKKAFQSFNGNYKKIKTEDQLTSFKNDLKTILNQLGVEITEKGFNYYLNNLDSESKDIEDIKKQIRNTYKKVLLSIKNNKDNIDNNLFKSESSLYNKIAEAEAFFQTEGSDASIFTLGKTKWAFSNPSFLDVKISQWKKDPQLLIDFYENDVYTKGSHWLYFLSAADKKNSNDRIEIAKERLSSIELNIFNSIQQEGDSINGSDTKNLSKTDSLVDYMNKVLAFKKGGKSYHKTALAADKSTEYQLFLGSNTDYFNLSTKGIIINENGIEIQDPKILEIFYKYYKSEYLRIGKVFDEIENLPENELIPNYHTGNKNGTKSQLFASLESELELFDENGEPLYSDLDQVKDIVITQINKSLAVGIKKTYDRLAENEVFNYDYKGDKSNNLLDEAVYSKYESMYKNKAFHHIAADMFINSVVSQVEYSKMFTGDVAYYKNMADYKKRVPATYSDGLYMRLTDINDKFFNASVIAGVEIGYEDIESLPKSVRKYYDGVNSKINTTDAQAWITPQRWKFIMKGLGKWNNSVESTYNKMISYYPKPFTAKDLKVLAQPLKGVYFDNINGRPIFLKYSQAVLMPGFIRGTKLESLYDSMVNDDNGNVAEYKDQIHELITKDGVKVGYPKPEVTHDEKGNLLENFKLNKIQLSNDYWKLQQDLPSKGVKETELGSQIQKNIFQGLSFNRGLDSDGNPINFYIDNEEYTADELIDQLYDVTKGLSDIGIDELKRILDIDSKFNIKNEDKLYSNILKQLKSRSGTPNNIVKALEARTSPYGIPGALNVFQNVFSSLINKHTVKIKTNGGSFIQMSDYGINRNEAIEQGIKFTPWFEDNKLQMPKAYTETYTDIDGLEQTRTKYKPGGIFISGSMLSKYIPDYESISPKDLFGTKENNYTDGMIDKKILDSIIGYRIPNQGLSSNDALEVMGILPPGMGDTVVAYTGLTTKTGSDFDIDKMFMMIPSFKALHPSTNIKEGLKYLKDNNINDSTIINDLTDIGYNTKTLAKKSLKELYIEEFLLTDDNGSELYNDFKTNYNYESVKLLEYVKYDKTKPVAEQSKKALQNRLIEVYKSVLTSEHTIEDVLSPVDDDYLELDIKNSTANNKKIDLLDFDAIHDIDIKNQFMLGKAGLGQNVNQLVDAVRGSLGDIGLVDYYLGWGEVNEDGNTVFDNEYSEKLSNKDIEDYIKYSNSDSEFKIDNKRLKNNLFKIKLSNSMMVLVNGFVDIAKDPYIVEGNWVTQTNNVGFMLLRAGVHPFKVNSFLGQPILKDYVNYRNNRESNAINDTSLLEEGFKVKRALDYVSNKYGDQRLKLGNLEFEYNSLFRTYLKKEDIKKLEYAKGSTAETMYTNDKYIKLKQQVIDGLSYRILKKFNLKTKDLNSDPQLFKQFNDFKNNDLLKMFEDNFELQKLPFSEITLGAMKDNINNNTDPQFQYTILEKFKEWQQQAKKLSDNVKASKVDVDGKGKDILAAVIASNRIRNILQKESSQGNEGEFFGFMTKLIKETDDGDKSTLLKTYLDNSVGFSQKVMQANPKYFLLAQPKVIETFNHISHHVYDESIVNEKLADKLQKDYYTYILSGFKPLQFDNEKSLKTMLINLPKQFNKLRKELNNPLLDELSVKPSTVKGVDFISMSNVKKSASYKNTLTDAWNVLLEKEPEFAENLIKYSYYISGFNNSLNQFHEFIPYEWFNKNGFNSYLKTLSLSDKEVDSNFKDQFFRNNLKNNTLSKQVFKSDISPLKNGLKTNSVFAISNDNFSKYKTPPYIVRQAYVNLENPLAETTYSYFKYAGISQDGRNSHIYTRVEELGFKDNKANKFVEFDINYPYKLSSSKKSMFNTNHLKNVDTALISKQQLSYDYPTDRNISEYIKEEQDVYAAYDTEESNDIANPDIGLNSVEEGDNIKYYEGNITPETDTVFVFGSNPEGRHGAGAAKVAINKFGAKYGQGEGLQGNAYALPTKDLRVKENNSFKSIDEQDITGSIITLYKTALNNPNKQFKIAYRNTTNASLNGYTGLEMIEMFNDAAIYTSNRIPSNIIFSKEWFDTGKLKRNDLFEGLPGTEDDISNESKCNE